MSDRDHPRACGAHFWPSYEKRGTMGSSPRMRGSHDARAFKPRETGIIPAHAGLTILQERRLVCIGDHPRACGAHSPSSAMSASVQGSSPRMRGSLYERDPLPGWKGIIPAHAGLTQDQFKVERAERDHPRACGAHVSPDQVSFCT